MKIFQYPKEESVDVLKQSRLSVAIPHDHDDTVRVGIRGSRLLASSGRSRCVRIRTIPLDQYPIIHRSKPCLNTCLSRSPMRKIFTVDERTSYKYRFTGIVAFVLCVSKARGTGTGSSLRERAFVTTPPPAGDCLVVGI